MTARKKNLTQLQHKRTYSKNTQWITGLLTLAFSLTIEKAVKTKSTKLRKAVNKIVELDRAINNIYMDNVCGKISDERFAIMLSAFETEQSQLKSEIETLRKELILLKKESATAQSLVKSIFKAGIITELSEKIVRLLVERIVVHEAVRVEGTINKKESQEIEIHLAFIN